MPFDGFVTKKIIAELNEKLIGGKVNKVLEPNKNEIVLQIYNNVSFNLNISCDPTYCKFSLTDRLKPNPQNAYNFCMLLRKYLTGSKICSITSYDLERTVEICFETYNELNDFIKMKLFIEIMSRQSNVILTNENNMIIDTLKHYNNPQRDLAPAHEYVPVPSTKKSFIELNSVDEFVSLFDIESENFSITKTIFSEFIGFSKPLIKESLKELGIDDNSTSISNIKRVYSYFKELINNLPTNQTTLVEINSGKDFIITNISYEDYALMDEYQIISANAFIDKYYYQKEKAYTFLYTRNNLLKVVSNSLKKVYKKLENINFKLKECEDLDRFKLYGELLTANLYKIKDEEHLPYIDLENYYDDNKIITIPLDKSLSISKNIEKYFKKYNKLKNALGIVSEQKKETEKELDYIESIVFTIENANTISELDQISLEISENLTTKKEYMKKNKKFSKIVPKNIKKQDEFSFDTLEIDGFVVYLGKNNIQNDYITLKLANANDLWFHVQKYHGSHILLKNPNNLEMTDDIIFKCAKLAKDNSKAKDSVNVAVDYCPARYVKKAPGAKPGMVIYTNYKTIIVK